MAIFDGILRRNGNGNGQTPFSNAPETDPSELTTGATPPQDPDRPPRVGVPLGASGRANFYGLPQADERNRLLIGPRGLEVFDEMYRTDGHVRRLVLAAWSPIGAGTWSMSPYGGDDATDLDREIADAVWWALTRYMSPNLFEHLATVGPVLLRAGFAPFEEIWAAGNYPKSGKTLMLPRKLDLRLPRSIWRWWQDDYGDLTHIGQILPSKADVVIPATELVYYRLAAEGDNWVGTSLLRHAYKHWYMKDRLERIAAIGEERKAVGVPVVYPPENADPRTKDAMEAVLAAMHTSEVAYLMMPGPKAGTLKDSTGKEWLVDVIQFDSSSGTSIQSVLEYHQQAIASSMLQDFLELGHHQVGARATAQVQEDPFLTAVDAIATPFVMPPLNRLIQRIVEVNWDKAEGAPELKLTLHDSASLSELAIYCQTLIGVGAMQADPELEDFLRNRADLPPANAKQRAEEQSAALPPAPADKPPGQDPANPDGGPAEVEQPPKLKPDKPPGKLLDQADATSGAMVALYPHPDDAAQLALDGGEPPDALHVTLAFCGPAAALSDPEQLHQAVARFAKSEAPVDAKVAGHGVFNQGPDPVTYHTIDSAQLPTMRHRLVGRLERHNVPVAKDHGFVPHITLAYADRGKDAAPPPGKLLRFTHISSVVGGERRDHRLGAPRARTLDQPAPEPTAKWWERLLSQDRLREALDGARAHVEVAAQAPALTAARKLAEQARQGQPVSDEPSAELVDALTAHYTDLYRLGHETVQEELAKQRQALGTQLDARDIFAAAGARVARARQRGEHSARSIVQAVAQRLRRDQVTGLKTPAALQQGAEQAATGQLHVEALANTAAQIGDGRHDAAMSDGNVIGGYYTSVLDGRTCDPCAVEDTDTLLTPDEAALATPNPLCEGADYCRCMIVWVLADDPAALAAVLG